MKPKILLLVLCVFFYIYSKGEKDLTIKIPMSELQKVSTENLDEYINAKVKQVISKELSNDDDHRLTLRIPKILMQEIDKQRKARSLGKVSRTLWILEVLEKATKK